MGHDVFAEQTAAVGEPGRMLVGRRVEHQERVLRRIGGEHHYAGLLHLPLLLGVVVFDPGHAGAGRIREDPGHRAHGRTCAPPRRASPRNVACGLASAPVGAAGAAPAVMDAGGAAFVLGAVHPDGARRDRDADRLEARHPDLTMPKGLERRHWIGLATRLPALLRLGVAGDPDLAGDAVVIRCEVGIGDRPVQGPAVLALHLEVGRQQPGEIGGIVQRRAAHAPAVIGGAPDRIAALIEDSGAAALEPPAPDVGADEIGELPIGALLQEQHLLAGAG